MTTKQRPKNNHDQSIYRHRRMPITSKEARRRVKLGKEKLENGVTYSSLFDVEKDKFMKIDIWEGTEIDRLCKLFNPILRKIARDIDKDIERHNVEILSKKSQSIEKSVDKVVVDQ